MVVKVPIYVEIERADPELLPTYVEHLGAAFTIILRREDFEKAVRGLTEEVRNGIGAFKIIQKSKAVEYLRTKK
jgi:hypothetical protein